MKKILLTSFLATLPINLDSRELPLEMYIQNPITTTVQSKAANYQIYSQELRDEENNLCYTLNYNPEFNRRSIEINSCDNNRYGEIKI